MSGEIIKTEGIAIAVRPWSRTSHIVTWLTPDHGIVTTLVKGAVRPKSAHLGQYDLFYTCSLLYYAGSKSDLHALREVAPVKLREKLRTRWRTVILSQYIANIVRNFVPNGKEAEIWFNFLENMLDEFSGDGFKCTATTFFEQLVSLEMKTLHLAGLAPDFSGMNRNEPWTPFSIEHGRCGEGSRTVRLTPSTVHILTGHRSTPEALNDAVRFLGLFMAYHIDQSLDIRRTVINLLRRI